MSVMSILRGRPAAPPGHQHWQTSLTFCISSPLQTQPRGEEKADQAAGGEDRREEVEGDGGHQAQGAAALHRAGERGHTH